MSGVEVGIDADGVATLVLAGEERGNPFTAGMGRQLGEAYRSCDQDDRVRVIVVTGQEPGFCVGASLASGGDTFDTPAEEFSASPIQPPAYDLRKPVIAAMNGPAVGIGLTLALQADLRIAALECSYGVVQVRRGVVPDAASHWTLPRIVGDAVATELLLTGRTVRGDRAERIGLVNEAVGKAEVLPRALETARDIAINTAPLSVAATKAMLTGARRHGWGPEEIAHRETVVHRALMGGPDAREGVTAFLEGRRPRWQGSLGEDWEGVDPTKV